MSEKIKKNYITRMPDKSGAFLKASKIISKNNGNIVRVNYNKAVDVHTLFIEVSASENEHNKIEKSLEKIGYLTDKGDDNKVVLIVLKLEDKAGSVTPVLEIIDKYDVNLSYLSSQENGTSFQHFKMGLMIDKVGEIQKLLEEISKICEVKIIDYDVTEKNLDNTVFYITFANEMREILSLSQEETNEVLISSNKIMQMLDDNNEKPMKTFEYIKKFASFVKEQKGENFEAEVVKEDLGEFTLYSILPPCGSNTFILQKEENLLFIDSGFPCYEREMIKLLTQIFPNFSEMNKESVITHADIDHVGLIHLMDKVYMSKNCYDNFLLEQKGKPNFREQVSSHEPYCELSKIISNYKTPSLNNFEVIGDKQDDKPLSKIGEIDFCGLKLEVMEGYGGHVKGEIVIGSKDKKIIITGDDVVNINGFSKKQYEFNLLAPYLMRSVNVNSSKATIIRKELINTYKEYKFYTGHGSPYIN